MKGVYLAFFHLPDSRSIEVGALGEIRFESGLYVYTGSAQKSAENRLERHFSGQENKFWHIDYFSETAEAIDYMVLPEKSRYECVMADILSDLGEPVEGFGCSDCGCDSHLFRIPSGF
jgi:Uri superfamily endonuclease